MAGVFYAAVGHVIDAEGGDVSGDDGADFEFLVGLEEQLGVASEDAGLHSEDGIVDLAQRLVEGRVGFHGNDWAEDFLAIHFHVGLGTGEDRGFDDQLVAVSAAEQSGSGADGFVDPAYCASGIGLANERTDVGGFIERVARLELLHAFDEQIGEFSVDRVFDKDPLDGDAGLASVGEASGDAAAGDVVEVGVAVNYYCGVATEFEDNFLFSGAALDVPSDGYASGEADEFDAVVGDEKAGVVVRERENVETAIGPSGLLHALSEKQRAERRLRRWLQDHGTSGGDGRSDFVGNQIDRKIEWSDARDWPNRETADDAPASGGELLPVEGKIFAVDAGAFLGGDVEGEDGAVDFDARGLDGLAGFLRERAGEFLFTFGHERGNLAENALPFEGGKATCSAEGFDGGGDGGVGVLFAALRDAGDQIAIVGSADLDKVALLLPPAVYEETVCRNRRDRHLCHVCLPPERLTCCHYRTFA